MSNYDDNNHLFQMELRRHPPEVDEPRRGFQICTGCAAWVTDPDEEECDRCITDAEHADQDAMEDDITITEDDYGVTFHHGEEQ